MTKQESFKRRVRERMESTGERYAAARRALVAQSPSGRNRVWVAEPEFGDAAVTKATGQGWEAWCDVIDNWPRHVDGHAAIATYLREQHNVDAWWAQSVTVGYERILGKRLPYQRADGTFTATKSRTVPINQAVLRALLLDDQERQGLLPGVRNELRSRPSTKRIRLALDSGTVTIGLEELATAKTKIDIAHEQLPTFDEVEQWKFFWSEWLDALQEE